MKADLIFPAADKILIREISEKDGERQSGGIIIPETAQSGTKPKVGVVLKVGKIDKAANRVSVGETLVFGLYSGTEIILTDEPHGDNFFVIHAGEVIASIGTVKEEEAA